MKNGRQTPMKSSRTVVSVVSADIRWSRRFFLEALALAEHGFRVHIIARAYRDESGSDLAEWEARLHDLGGQITWLSLRSYGVGPRWVQWILGPFEFLVRAALVVRSIEGPLILEAHDYVSLPVAWLLSILKKGRLVYFCHELFSEGLPRGVRTVWKRLKSAILPQLDGLIVPEANRAEILVREYGVRVEPVVIVNSPPLLSIERRGRLRRLMDRNGLADFEHVAIYVGLLSPARAIDTIIRGAQLLAPGICTIIVGFGADQYISSLRAEVETQGCSTRCAIADPVSPSEALELIAEADVGIALYRDTNRNNYYCAPNKIFEYMMCGVPIVCSAFPGLKSIVDEHEVGLAVDPEDPADFASAINFLCSKQCNRAAMQQRATEVFRRKYRWEHQAEKIVCLFEKLSIQASSQ